MKKMKLALVATLMAASFSLSSCASLFLGSTQKLKINSNVQTNVILNGEKIGQTNENLTVPRKQLPNGTIYLEKEGCKSRFYDLQTKESGLVWVNLIPMTGLLTGALIAAPINPLLGVSTGVLVLYPLLLESNHYKTQQEHTVNLICD